MAPGTSRKNVQSMVEISDGWENVKKIFFTLQTILKTHFLGQTGPALSNGDISFILGFADFDFFVILWFQPNGDGFAYAVEKRHFFAEIEGNGLEMWPGVLMIVGHRRKSGCFEADVLEHCWNAGWSIILKLI